MLNSWWFWLLKLNVFSAASNTADSLPLSWSLLPPWNYFHSYLCNTTTSTLPSSYKSFSKFMRCSFRLIVSRILSYSFLLIPRWSHSSWLHYHMHNHWQGQCMILAQIDILYIPLDISIWVSRKYQMSYVKDELSIFFIKYSWLSMLIGWILGFKVL